QVKEDADQDQKCGRRPYGGPGCKVHLASPYRATDFTAAATSLPSTRLPSNCWTIAAAVSVAILSTSFMAVCLIEAILSSAAARSLFSLTSTLRRSASAAALALSRDSWPMALALRRASASSCS